MITLFPVIILIKDNVSYALVWPGHPSNCKQGGVCIIKILSLKLICIHHLQESIKLKVRIEENL